jgi:hypothetical protein
LLNKGSLEEQSLCIRVFIHCLLRILSFLVFYSYVWLSSYFFNFLQILTLKTFIFILYRLWCQTNARLNYVWRSCSSFCQILNLVKLFARFEVKLRTSIWQTSCNVKLLFHQTVLKDALHSKSSSNIIILKRLS